MSISNFILHKLQQLINEFENITIKFIDGINVLISSGEIKQKFNYKDMGFEDSRKLKPNTQWEFLKILAKHKKNSRHHYRLTIVQRYKHLQPLKDTLSNNNSEKSWDLVLSMLEKYTPHK